MGFARRGCQVFGLASAFLFVLSPFPSLTQAQEAPPPGTVQELSEVVWAEARAGKADAALRPMRAVPAETSNAALQRLREASVSLDSNIRKREEARAKKVEEVGKEFDAALAEEVTHKSLSKALKSAVELYMLSVNKHTTLQDPRLQRLIEQAAAAARTAENRGEWLQASELFFRLNTLLEDQGTYKADMRRLSDRLEMLRLYVPERFYELRTAQAKDHGEEIAPYNGLGEDYRKKLHGIDDSMVVKALALASERQVDRDRIGMRELLLGGIGSLKTLVTTADLQRTFDGIADTDAREAMLQALSEEEAKVDAPEAALGPRDMRDLVLRLRAANAETVKLPEEAMLHEFGNGAMGELDEFSAVIWPDEKARFDRMTQGEFKGVGIQIQMEKGTSMIKVVTPLEGTPAHRAGVRRGDLIVKIDGSSALGLSLNQAVDLITGPEGTKVTLTMKRDEQEIDYELQRAVIPLITVKGWKRLGPKEDQWDWYIDPDNKIGYIRLLQFTDHTTRDLAASIKQLQKDGLNGLILDLRFNPGGLLTQAVSVANAFIKPAKGGVNTEDGLIVSTRGTMPPERHSARASRQLLHDVPLVVLINEGSASASEIVSGAIAHYADAGLLRAIIVGARSFGKGSVQNVWPLNAEQTALLKLTTQYYELPSGRILHRKLGSEDWGVAADLEVEMLPEQIVESLRMRQDADVVPLDAGANADPAAQAPQVDPAKLLTDGVDLQLETALVLLQLQSAAKGQEHVRLN